MNEGLNWSIGDLILGRYRITHILGFGGMGSVYAAKDEAKGGLEIALKLLPKTQERYLQKFRQEFSVLANSRHPNVLGVFDFHLEPKGKVHFYTAELLRGKTLQEEKGHWTNEEIQRLLMEVSRALNFLHARGVTHGDIKPSNIIRKEGGGFVLLDFGVSRLQGQFDWKDVGGTPSYMAPEIRLNRLPDHRADFFSLGLTAFRCATGINPFAKLWKSKKIEADPIPPRIRDHRKDLSIPLEETIEKLIAWNPDARFQTGAQILRHVHEISEEKLPLETQESLQAYLKSSHLVGRKELLSEILALSGIGKMEIPLPSVQVFLINGPYGIGKSRFAEELFRRFQLAGVSVEKIQTNKEKANPILLLFKNDEETSTSSIGSISSTSSSWSSQDPAPFGKGRKTWIIDDVDLLSMEDFLSLNRFIRRKIAEHPQNVFLLSAERASALAHLRIPLRKIDLEPLEKDDVAEYVSTIPYSFHPKVIEAVHEKSRGIPLLVLNTLQSLLSEIEDLGKIEAVEKVHAVDLAKTTGKAFRSKLSELSKGSLEALRTIALARTRLPFSDLLKELEKRDSKAFESLKTLLSSQMIRTTEEDGLVRVQIENPGLAAVLASDLGKAKRYHQVIAQALLSHLKEKEGPGISYVRATIFHSVQAGLYSDARTHLQDLSEELLAGQMNAEAVEVFDENLPILLKKLGPDRIRRSLELAADAYFRVGRLEESKSMVEAVPLETPEDRVRFHRKLAEISIRQRRLPDANLNIQKAKKLLLGLDSREEETRLASVHQIYALHKGDWDLLERFSQEFQKADEKIFWKEKILSLCIQGHAARGHGETEKAIGQYQLALQESRRLNYPGGQAMALGSLALCQQILSEDMDALDSFQKAIEAAEEAYDVPSLATHSLNHGRLLEEMGDYQRALTSYQRSMELYEKCKNWGAYAHSLYRHTHLLFFLEKELDVEGMSKAQNLAILHDHRSISTYCKLALARNSKKELEWKRMLSEVEQEFLEVEDTSGLLETKLVLLEKGVASEALPFGKLSLPQKVRLAEAQWSEKSQSTEPFRQQLLRTIREAEEMTNQEWRMRVLHLQSQVAITENERRAAKDMARQARILLEKISSQFEGTLQRNYLSSRGHSKMEEILEDTVVHAAPNKLEKKESHLYEVQELRSDPFEEALLVIRAEKGLTEKLESGLSFLSSHIQGKGGLVGFEKEGQMSILARHLLTPEEAENLVAHSRSATRSSLPTNSEGPTVSKLTGYRMQDPSSFPSSSYPRFPLPSIQQENWFVLLDLPSTSESFKKTRTGVFRLFLEVFGREIELWFSRELLERRERELASKERASLLRGKTSDLQTALQRRLRRKKFDLLQELDQIAEEWVKIKLDENDGNKSKTARDLGLSRSGLLKMLERFTFT